MGRVGVGLEFSYLHHAWYFFCGLNGLILIYGMFTLSVLILSDLLCCSIG